MTSPRIATASKDGTVRIWHTGTRKLDFVLTGHSASVNVVRWGGEGVIYTGSSDRTVKVWSAVDVSRPLDISTRADCQGKLIRTLSEHAHWVNTMALSTDFVLRTGPFDHTSKKPKDDEEGMFLKPPERGTRLTPSSVACSRTLQGSSGHAAGNVDHRIRRPHPLPLA